MEKLTAQEIAKRCNQINFESVQCDDIHENNKVAQLLHIIERQYSHKEGLRILLKVLEVKDLQLRHSFNDINNPFKGMEEFNYLNENLEIYPNESCY